MAVHHSRFVRNHEGAYVHGTHISIGGSLSIDSSTMTHNLVGTHCVNVFCFVTNNRYAANGVGVSTFALNTFLNMRGNTVVGNTVGVHANFNRRSDAIGNIFAQNRTAAFYDMTSGQFSSNTLIHNASSFTMTGDVIFPDSNFSGVLIDGNTATLNKSDGFHVDRGGFLKGNLAIANSGHGIYATESTDLGGNAAIKNRISPQCVGVVC